MVNVEFTVSNRFGLLCDAFSSLFNGDGQSKCFGAKVCCKGMRNNSKVHHRIFVLMFSIRLGWVGSMGCGEDLEKVYNSKTIQFT